MDFNSSKEEQSKKHFELSEMFVKELTTNFQPAQQNEAIIYALQQIVQSRKALIESNCVQIDNLNDRDKFLRESLSIIDLIK